MYSQHTSSDHSQKVMSYICLNVPFLTLWIPRTHLKVRSFFTFSKMKVPCKWWNKCLFLLQNVFSFPRYLRFCIFKHIIWWCHMFNSQQIKNTLPLISHELEELSSCNLANLIKFNYKNFDKRFNSKIWSAN